MIQKQEVNGNKIYIYCAEGKNRMSDTNGSGRK